MDCMSDGTHTAAFVAFILTNNASNILLACPRARAYLRTATFRRKIQQRSDLLAIEPPTLHGQPAWIQTGLAGYPPDLQYSICLFRGQTTVVDRPPGAFSSQSRHHAATTAEGLWKITLLMNLTVLLRRSCLFNTLSELSYRRY